MTGRLNGATYVLISATLSVLIFPKPIAIMAFTVLIFADLTAALVGTRYGRHRFLAKSVEGSAAFFVTAVLIMIILPRASGIPGDLAVGITAALAATIVEAADFGIDDNLSVPLTTGIVLWIGYAVFQPGMDLLIPHR